MVINKQETSACCDMIPKHNLGDRMGVSVSITCVHGAAHKLKNTSAIVQNTEASKTVGHQEVL